eukprot:2977242-Rhodomonas_salina.1
MSDTALLTVTKWLMSGSMSNVCGVRDDQADPSAEEGEESAQPPRPGAVPALPYAYPASAARVSCLFRTRILPQTRILLVSLLFISTRILPVPLLPPLQDMRC